MDEHDRRAIAGRQRVLRKRGGRKQSKAGAARTPRSRPRVAMIGPGAGRSVSALALDGLRVHRVNLSFFESMDAAKRRLKIGPYLTGAGRRRNGCGFAEPVVETDLADPSPRPPGTSERSPHGDGRSTVADGSAVTDRGSFMAARARRTASVKTGVFRGRRPRRCRFTGRADGGSEQRRSRRSAEAIGWNAIGGSRTVLPVGRAVRRWPLMNSKNLRGVDDGVRDLGRPDQRLLDELRQEVPGGGRRQGRRPRKSSCVPTTERAT